MPGRFEHGLTRPQQKSFPHINGLYLLLRTTGLARAERRGAKHFLVLDQTALDLWHSLNPTEQYCTLLETWLLRWNGEITGERHGPFQHPRTQWSQFFQRIPAKGLKIAGNKNEESIINFMPGLINIALLELFGCLSCRGRSSCQRQRLADCHSPQNSMGTGVRAAADVQACKTILSFFSSSKKTVDRLRRLALCSPSSTLYLPAWQNNLVLPEAEFQAGTYIFKVSLGKIWRRIAVRGDMVLEDLSDSILAAYDFDNDHLYCFEYRTRYGTTAKVNHPYMEDQPPWTDEVKIGDIGLTPKDQMTYIFDFGDWWQFNVQLERIDPVDPKLKKPKLLESHGEAPEQYPDIDDWDEGEWDEEDEP